MRVEAADVASALDKLSYEKVSYQGRKSQTKFSFLCIFTILLIGLPSVFFVWLKMVKTLSLYDF